MVHCYPSRTFCWDLVREQSILCSSLEQTPISYIEQFYAKLCYKLFAILALSMDVIPQSHLILVLLVAAVPVNILIAILTSNNLETTSLSQKQCSLSASTSFTDCTYSRRVSVMITFVNTTISLSYLIYSLSEWSERLDYHHNPIAKPSV